MSYSITDDLRPESFYQGMTEPEQGDSPQTKAICHLCDENSAMVEVTFKTRKELACLSCYSTPDYQKIIKRDNPFKETASMH